MKKIKTYKIMAMISVLVLTLLLMACGGSNKPENMLIGNWLSNYNDIAIFEEDGRCTAPFTYNASWGESADHYIFKEDGTLVFSSSEGDAGGTYDKADTAEEARYNRSKYYLEKDLFIVEKDTYTRTK